MSFRLRLVPFARPRDRAVRLPVIVVAGLAVLVVAVWNPVTTPGPTLCWARLAFGIPCPLCGGTRGAALALRGRIGESVEYNPLSIPALAFAGWMIGRAAFEYASGKQVILDRPRWLRVSTPYLITAALLGTWVYLLMYRIEDDFGSSWLGMWLR
jgi:Protein of unknown function (DUF2752)